MDQLATVIDQALAFHGDTLKDPLNALACVGGRELAAIAGAILAARLQRVPVVLEPEIEQAAGAFGLDARRRSCTTTPAMP